MRRMLSHLLERYHRSVQEGRYIPKKLLYLSMSQWFHFSKRETRDVLNMMAADMPGIIFTGAGLYIPHDYLYGPPGLPTPERPPHNQQTIWDAQTAQPS